MATKFFLEDVAAFIPAYPTLYSLYGTD